MDLLQKVQWINHFRSNLDTLQDAIAEQTSLRVITDMYNGEGSGTYTCWDPLEELTERSEL